MAKTHIVVLKMKKLLRIALPVTLVFVILLLFFLLFPGKDATNEKTETVEPTATVYCPGVYTSVISLNDTLLNLEVVVDTDHINSVRLVNLDEATAAMYPLMEPVVEEISASLASGTALSDITLSENSKYTQALLLDSIRATLEKAKPRS